MSTYELFATTSNAHQRWQDVVRRCEAVADPSDLNPQGEPDLGDLTDALALANGLKPWANQDTVGDMTWHTWAGKVETIDAYASGELGPAWSADRMAAAKRDADAFNDAPELF